MRTCRLVLSIAALAACASAGASEWDWGMKEDTSPRRDDPLMDDHAAAPTDVHPSVNDLRLGVSILTAPHIQEDIDVPGVGHAHYKWVGASGSGFGAALSGLTTPWRPARWLAFECGGELQYAWFDTTPDSYRVKGVGLVTNTQKFSLNYQSLSLDLIAGWATTPVETVIGDMHVELLGVGGYGLIWADTEGFTTGGSPSKQRGAGTAWNIGPRLGVYVADAGWVFGVHGDWVWSQGKVDIALPGGQTSHLQADGKGAAGTVEAGYRF
jgi:hypothetical protein